LQLAAFLSIHQAFLFRPLRNLLGLVATLLLRTFGQTP
jgi:hypothetical protein